MNNDPSPSEINEKYGTFAYRCRPCGATENLSWYRDTSCPTCGSAPCLKFLDEEWAQAYGGDES